LISFHSHSDYIKGYFNFIEFLIEFSNGKLDFTKEQIKDLWTYFITKRSATGESDLLYKDLMKYKLTSYTLY